MKILNFKQIIALIGFALLIVPAPALSQEIQYKLKDAGVLNHSIHGKGIEIQIIPLVTKNQNISNLKYIAVRALYGEGIVKLYVLNAYSIKNGTCHKQL